MGGRPSGRGRLRFYGDTQTVSATAEKSLSRGGASGYVTNMVTSAMKLRSRDEGICSPELTGGRLLTFKALPLTFKVLPDLQDSLPNLHGFLPDLQGSLPDLQGSSP